MSYFKACSKRKLIVQIFLCSFDIVSQVINHRSIELKAILEYIFPLSMHVSID